MHRRATPKKCVAEVEKEINMDDKEVTPGEDIEEILHPAEPNRPVQQEEQPEKPTQTGDANLMEMMKKMMEENRKNIESLKEDSQKILNR